MANNIMANVPESFNLEAFADQVAAKYQAQGYKTSVVKMNQNVKIKIEKDLGGINTVLGMGVGISVDMILSGNMLNINFTEPEWTSKIIACAIGWFVCFVPVVTGIIGIMNQLNLPKTLENDIRMLLSQN